MSLLPLLVMGGITTFLISISRKNKGPKFLLNDFCSVIAGSYDGQADALHSALRRKRNLLQRLRVCTIPIKQARKNFESFVTMIRCSTVTNERHMHLQSPHIQ